MPPADEAAIERALKELGEDEGEVIAELRYLLENNSRDPASWARAALEDKPEPLISAPVPEPAVRSVYEDCRHPYLLLGYSETPPRTRVVPLSRKKYTEEEGEARFAELQQRFGWKVVGEKFYDARFWCWRIQETE